MHENTKVVPQAQTYRFNHLDMRNHLRRFDESDFASDVFACERARAISNSEPIEVWQGSRFVCRVEADGEFVEGQIVVTRLQANSALNAAPSKPTTPNTPTSPGNSVPTTPKPVQPSTPKPKIELLVISGSETALLRAVAVASTSVGHYSLKREKGNG